MGDATVVILHGQPLDTGRTVLFPVHREQPPSFDGW